MSKRFHFSVVQGSIFGGFQPLVKNASFFTGCEILTTAGLAARGTGTHVSGALSSVLPGGVKLTYLTMFFLLRSRQQTEV